ncbi:MAG: hypothetical protein IJ766_02275 [Clostridia bacterium]|nr:hypothetical protein [Clostridia bacterium]
MNDIVFLLLFCDLLIDISAFVFTRDCFLSLLKDQMSVSKAKKIHAAQSYKNKLFMNYVSPLITRNREKFDRIHRAFVIFCGYIPVKYILILIFAFVFSEKVFSAFLLAALLPSMIFFLVFRISELQKSPKNINDLKYKILIFFESCLNHIKAEKTGASASGLFC